MLYFNLMDANYTGNSDKILRIENLSRTVPDESGQRVVIDSFSFEFHKGKIYTVVGPSGSGKTSLLRLINRLDEKSGGEVYFENRPVEEYAVTELRSKVALVFQIPYLFPGTVASNLSYCCPDKTGLNDDTLTRYLNLVGLEAGFAKRDPDKLSVGQKQRVALARALVQEPEILLLDEPTSALDPGASRTIEDLIISLNRELKLTIIMVTHNFRQAERLNDTSLLLIDGKLIESGNSKELFGNPKNELTRRFVNGELR